MGPRRIADYRIHPIGLGCMGLSHAYGHPPSERAAVRLIHMALDLGASHLDTAAMYGFGSNESLLGRALQGRRHQVLLASKCGMTGVDGVRVIDGRPETLRRTIDESLARLNTDCIDLYYLHRWDRKVPIEDSVGALSEMVAAGKVRTIGLSEVSAERIERAQAIHPIAAVQTEYSLWTRNAEIAVSDLCRRLGIAFVAFSPLGRGFLADALYSPAALTKRDLRRNMPRFQQPHFARNLQLLPGLREMAADAGVTTGQLALAWLLHQGEHVLPIPGTTSGRHLQENLGATQVQLSDEQLRALDRLINKDNVSGPRYAAATQAEIDTEEF